MSEERNETFVDEDGVEVVHIPDRDGGPGVWIHREGYELLRQILTQQAQRHEEESA